MNKVLIIGGNGYIGTHLFNFLNNDEFLVDVVDTCWFQKTIEKTIVDDYKNLSKEFYSEYDSIVLLAGHSSVKMSEGKFKSCFNNNVSNFINILEKLNKKQKFIYASSSSVYGSVGGKTVSEKYYGFKPYNQYDISKHIIDLYAEKSDLQYYGLRFGTVCGYSPFMRNDVMINAMVSSALINNEIKLYIKDIMRPVLGIEDLCKSVKTIIQTSEDKRGLYNLASFNKTAEQIAYEVSDVMGVKVTEYDVDPTQTKNTKLQTKTYNFSISTKKFCKTFKFNFNETVETITNGIVKNWDNIIKTDRSTQIEYK
jgi:UDP-glucose 4-epimerase